MRKLIATFLLAVCPSLALAQAYPSKPVRLVVPAAPGGTSDFTGRLIGQKLSELLGQPFVVENRPGAGNTIGAAVVAKAAPDGYTLLLIDTTVAISPAMYSSLPYDTGRDLAPVALVATAPYALVVGPKLKAQTLAELVAAAKAAPGKLSYASGGAGTGPHLAGFTFAALAGIDLVHIPYKGGGPALQDVLAGQVDLMFSALPTAMPHIRSGKATGLAVSSAKRSPSAMDLPTVAESGYQRFDVTSWFGIAAPANTPKDIIARLNAAVNQSLQSPDVRERLAAQGAVPGLLTSEEFDRYFRGEMQRWSAVVRQAGVKVD